MYYITVYIIPAPMAEEKRDNGPLYPFSSAVASLK